MYIWCVFLSIWKWQGHLLCTNVATGNPFSKADSIVLKPLLSKGNVGKCIVLPCPCQWFFTLMFTLVSSAPIQVACSIFLFFYYIPAMLFGLCVSVHYWYRLCLLTSPSYRLKILWFWHKVVIVLHADDLPAILHLASTVPRLLHALENYLRWYAHNCIAFYTTGVLYNLK